jgi:ATP-dependent Clp protease ATP-binding subunit ClpC
MSKPSLRVYFVEHAGGRRTGTLMRTWDELFDRPAPSAYGGDEGEVLRQLEVQLQRLEAEEPGALQRYLWTERFETRKVRVDVFPLTSVKKRPVIGSKRIPLRLGYAACAMAGGGYRIMVPRFGGWFVVEALELAPEILRHAVSTWLLGENPRWIYDFREAEDEYVREWEPRLLTRTGEASARASDEPTRPSLLAVAEDLVDRAAKGKLPRAIGASPELDALLATAFSARGNAAPPSLLIVGPPGVGKTTFVHRLARAMLERGRKDADAATPGLWATSADRLIAGMIYLGQWQERCLSVITELDGDGDWLFVDRLAPFLAGRGDGSSIADLFAPALESGAISLIAECTEPELAQARRTHGAFVDRFRVIRLAEPDASSMEAFATTFLASRKPPSGAPPTLHPQASRRMLRHLAAFHRDLAFPGKAVRFLEWLAQSGDAPSGTLYPRDVSEAFARFSGLPLELVSDDLAASAEQLAEKLRARVIGQDAACDGAARLLARFKAGVNDPERPIASLLFVGPTGVGKTELAKQLARVVLGDEGRLIRLDMSEYALRGAAQRLLEVGPGVRSLAQQVRDRPLSLVLFDEIEKASPDVFDLLLGVLGEGRLTDASGRLVDFRGTICVLTSNLGAGEGSAMGFGAGASSAGSAGSAIRDAGAAVRRHFRPELVARFDRVVSFRPLAFEDVERIVELELAAVGAREGMQRRGLWLSATAGARRALATLGFDPEMGARPLKRAIEERVVAPLAVALARDPGFRDRLIALLGPGDAPPRGAFAIAIEPG